MEKPSNVQPILLVAVLIVGTLLVSGCTGDQGNATQQQDGTNQAAATAQGNGQPQDGTGAAAPQMGGRGQQGYGNRPGFGNLTAEQRQQIFQAMAAACQGLSAGDSCTAQTPMGSRNGTCFDRNSTLTCITQMGRFNRTAASP